MATTLASNGWDWNGLYASSLPASSTPVPTVAASGGSSLGGFFSGLADFLKPAVEAAAVIGVTNAVNSGRLPGTQQYQNPTTATPGYVGQPNTQPAAVTNVAALQNLLPWAVVAAVVIGGIVVAKKL